MTYHKMFRTPEQNLAAEQALARVKRVKRMSDAMARVIVSLRNAGDYASAKELETAARNLADDIRAGKV